MKFAQKPESIMKFPQKPESIVAHYYFQDLIDFNDLPAAGEALIANCEILQPELLLLLSQEMQAQNEEIKAALGIKGAENTYTVFENTSEVLAADQKHVKQGVAMSIIEKLKEIGKPAYLMQFPNESDNGFQTVISATDFNQLNYKQNLSEILGEFAPNQIIVNSQDELLQKVIELQTNSSTNKLVLKNPTIEGGMGVQIIHNLQNLSQSDLIKIIEKLGTSPCYLIVEFLEGKEYATEFKVENGVISLVNHCLQIVDNGCFQGHISSSSLTEPNVHMEGLINLLTPYFKGYSGIFGLDYIINNQGDLKALEINPRFTGNTVGSLVCESFTQDFFAASIKVKYTGISSDSFTEEVINSATHNLTDYLEASSGIFPIQWAHAGTLGMINFFIKASTQDELQTILTENFSENPNLGLTIQTLNQI